MHFLKGAFHDFQYFDLISVAYFVRMMGSTMYMDHYTISTQAPDTESYQKIYLKFVMPDNQNLIYYIVF